MRTWLACLAFLAACGDDQDPSGARALWDRIHEADYHAWQTAPGYFERQPSDSAHGDAVQIWVNAAVAETLAGGADEWPIDSVIVKDQYDGGDFFQVAAMEKREDGWFWAEWNTRGESSYSGHPSTCTDCHERGDDFVRAFRLP